MCLNLPGRSQRDWNRAQPDSKEQVLGVHRLGRRRRSHCDHDIILVGSRPDAAGSEAGNEATSRGRPGFSPGPGPAADSDAPRSSDTRGDPQFKHLNPKFFSDLILSSLFRSSKKGNTAQKIKNNLIVVVNFWQTNFLLVFFNLKCF